MTIGVIRKDVVTEATREMLPELHLVMFVSFALQQKDSFNATLRAYLALRR